MLVVIATLAPIFINVIGGLFLMKCVSRIYRNRWYLSLFMFNSCLLFIGHFLYFQRYVAIYHYYDFIFLFSLLSFFPLYYVYVRSVFDFQISLKRYLSHFLPAVIISVSALTLSLTAGYPGFSEYFDRMADEIPLTTKLSGNLFAVYQAARVIHTIQIISYGFLIIHYIRGNLCQLKDYFSNMEVIQPRYFFVINGFFLFFMISSGLITTLSGRGAFANDAIILCLSGLIFSLAHLVVSLHGIEQVPVNLEIPEEERPSAETFNNLGNGEEIEKQLLSYFITDRPWLNPNLKIWDVVLSLRTNRTYLSAVINKRLNNNFNDFVNDYRIREAISIIREDNHSRLTLQAIAEMSGFGSSISFIRAFRKTTGQTPSEYRKQQDEALFSTEFIQKD